LDKALEIGATHAVSALDGDVFDQVSAITGIDDGYRGRSAKIDAVFDCAGYIAHMKGPPPLETALKLVSNKGGRIICFGGFEGAMTIDMGPIIQKEPVIMGSNGYAAEELVEALDLMQGGVIDRRCLITKQCSIEDVGDAFEIQMKIDQVKVLFQI
jgi:threonine dehydrogenase-like Zn-dependent dehydrogenase